MTEERIFFNELRNLRISRKLSLQDVAEKINCTAQYLHDLESSRVHSFDRSTIDIILRTYKTNYEKVVKSIHG